MGIERLVSLVMCSMLPQTIGFGGLAWLRDALHEIRGSKDELATSRVSCGEGPRGGGDRIPGFRASLL